MTYFWLILAIAAVIAELALQFFAFIFVALGALAASLAAAFGQGLVVQAILFLLTVIVGLSLMRPRLVRRFSSKRHLPHVTDTLIGKKAVVAEEIDPTRGTGRVMVNGHDWAATGKESIAAGSAVEIVSADGIVLHVRKGS